MINKGFFTVLLFISTVQLFAQDTAVNVKPRVRNVFWFTPVTRNTIINGLALGAFSEPWKSAEYLRINGINVEVNPLYLYVGMFALVGMGRISTNYNRDTSDTRNTIILGYCYPDSSSDYDSETNGLSLSAGNMSYVKGLSISFIMNAASKGEGVEVTGLMNVHHDFRGLMIAGIRNKTTTAKGVQIALINTCKEEDSKVLQIGLINIIGKRIIPLINFNFKKHKHKGIKI